MVLISSMWMREDRSGKFSWSCGGRGEGFSLRRETLPHTTCFTRQFESRAKSIKHKGNGGRGSMNVVDYGRFVSSPLSSMQGYANDDAEERIVNEEYKVWKKNTPFLYGEAHMICGFGLDRVIMASNPPALRSGDHARPRVAEPDSAMASGEGDRMDGDPNT